ncbi:MAG: hypothetical protein GDA36_03990 [Rhodobacteraceae bacterium]|nr:hypothetical protein [Paracoccaceae bacterium]
MTQGGDAKTGILVFDAFRHKSERHFADAMCQRLVSLPDQKNIPTRTRGLKMKLPGVICAAIAIAVTAACTPSPPVQDYASENIISFRYSAYDYVPTLTAEAWDKAIGHCAQFGKFANYKGGNDVNAWTAEEVHTFTCDDQKLDDGLVIAGQSKRPDINYNYTSTTVVPTIRPY